ncbi:MAG: PIG-L family deacetylase [Phycisphaerales bacterium]|nr:PIG-L family deacetylase [Phycisphaerales bacterium]
MSLATHPFNGAMSDAVAALNLPPDARVLDIDPGEVETQIDADRPIECIVACGVLERARWPRWLLRRMYHTLVPGGHLVLSVPNRCAIIDRIAAFPLCVTGRMTRRSDAVHATCRPTRRDPDSLSAPRCYSPSELNRQLNEVGFEVRNSRTHRRCFHELDGRGLPRRLTAAVDWGLEQVNRGAGVEFLKHRGGRYLAVTQKPDHSTGAARIDMTPCLTRAIDGFESFYAAEYTRLRSWQNQQRGDWTTLPPAAVHDTIDQCRSLLVLSPHPDDELIGCGGLMLDVRSRGGRVSVIQMTDGAECQALRDADEQTRRTIRSDEARDVADRMGVTHLAFLDAPNGRLDDSPPNVRNVRNVLKWARPEIICVPFINDRHVDHVAANRVLSSALGAIDDGYQPLILAYEVWSLVPPHVARPIDVFAHRKLDLLMHYPTPMKVVDYIWHCQVRDGHHSRQYLHQTGFAEAFLATTRSTYQRLVGAHRRGADRQIPADPALST